MEKWLVSRYPENRPPAVTFDSEMLKRKAEVRELDADAAEQAFEAAAAWLRTTFVPDARKYVMLMISALTIARPPLAVRTTFSPSKLQEAGCVI